jgi:uncharacterized protein
LSPQSFRSRERAGEPRDAPMNLQRLSMLTAVRTIAPAYFDNADLPWLRALLDERERFVGQKRRDWEVRISEPLPISAPTRKLRVALRVLDHLSRDAGVSPVPPKRIRSLVFRLAAREPDRARALAQATVQLGMPQQAILDALFADMPDERILTPLLAPLALAEFVLACNGAIVTSLLEKALRVRVVARGEVRAVVRHVRFMGLLCRAAPGAAKDEVELEISGPFALFRHTRIYGRALSSLVPRLSWCKSYRLEADCVLGSGNSVGRLVLGSGEPLAPAREFPKYDSKVEARFAREFGQLAREWDVVREPQAIQTKNTLIFPDFELRHRATGERWLVEIVGFWTADYVQKKLSLLKGANIERLILCVDEERCCTDDGLDVDARVVRYRRRVDPRLVLEIVDPGALARLP